MKISTYNNRTAVTFNLVAFGNDFVIKSNQITHLSKKYNAQEMLFSNQSHLKFDNKGNIIGYNSGNSGGTITFHSHSCNHQEASQELINLLLSFGMEQPKYFIEVVKTQRADGTSYKRPQYFIEEVK